MVLVLEGPEGAGKTSLANRLAADGFIRYRTLQPQRLSASEIADWREMGVPLNTRADDVYTLDLLAALHRGGASPNVVLDRSMVSGVLYSPLGTPRHRFDLHDWDLLEWWANVMAEISGRIVWLDGDPAVLAQRLGSLDRRAQGTHLPRVRSGFDALMPYVAKVRTLRVDTTDSTSDGVYEAVRAWL